MYDKDVVILKDDRFIPCFYYASNKNIAKENLYEKFGLANDVIVHKKMALRLLTLIPVLKTIRLKLLITDAYRPLEIQEYLFQNWEKFTGKKPGDSLAPNDSAPHPRGIAIDAVFADENGEKLPQPSSSINFNPEQRNPDYIFPDIAGEKEKERNRNLLRKLMVCSGISPINKEWFHFQLPDKEMFQIIKLEDLRDIKTMENNNEMYDTCQYYNVSDTYENDAFPGKNHFWINDASYFEQIDKINLHDFCDMLFNKDLPGGTKYKRADR